MLRKGQKILASRSNKQVRFRYPKYETLYKYYVLASAENAQVIQNFEEDVLPYMKDYEEEINAFIKSKNPISEMGIKYL